MNYTVESSRVILPLEGRITSDNAPELMRRLQEILDANPSLEPVFDLDKTEYMSSAGLRVLLTVRQRWQKPLELRNVSPGMLEILNVTGFSTMFTLKKKIREIDLTGCGVIGHGQFGTVYRLDADTIVKIYNMPDSLPAIEDERNKARSAFLKGVPTAISFDIVKAGDCYGTVFELLKAKTYNDLIRNEPENADALIAEYTDFLRSVHAVEMDPGIFPLARDVFLGYLSVLREVMPPEQLAAAESLLRDLPEDYHMVHGDFQMKNVMRTESGPMLIDMDTLCTGQPVFDLQALYVSYILFGEGDPDNSMAFLGIPGEMARRIWNTLFRRYLCSDDPAVLNPALDRIILLACLRFLYIILTTDHRDSPLGPVRIRRALEHLSEVIPRVSTLIL